MNADVTALHAVSPAPIPVRRGREFLNVPGPTNIPERILRAMNRSAVDFSGPEFIELSKSVFSDLKPLFRTDGEVFLYGANGHGGWEAALANTVVAGDAVLLPETGNFSAGWTEMAKKMGIEVVTIPNDGRRAIDPNAVEDLLRADAARRIKAVLMVHTDTATGVTSDIRAVRSSIDAAAHPALFMVDAIASFATVDIQMDAWDVDVVVTASQKGLMCAPGVALVGAGPKALAHSETVESHTQYWDWGFRRQKEHYRRYCGTAPEHIVFGLREAMDMIAEETMEGVVARHARLAEAVRLCVGKWCEAGALQFNAVVPAERSNAVTTILLPDGFTTDMVRDVCRDQYSVAVGGGLGHLQGRAFRIGHLGDNNEPMILGCLAAVEAGLKRIGLPIGEGGLPTAIDWLSRPSVPGR